MSEAEHAHQEITDTLQAAADWAGLERHWMAFQRTEAITKALSVTRAGAKPSVLISFLVKFHEAPLELRNKPDQSLIGQCSQLEAATLYLMFLYPRAVFCELASQFETGQQCQLLEVGINAAEDAVKLARTIGDLPVAAFFCALRARGLKEMNRLNDSLLSYQEALESYRKLAKVRPEVCLSEVAMTLYNLGSVQRGMNQLEGAQQSLKEALDIRRQLADASPEAYLPEVAMTLNSLGSLQRDMDQLEEAQQSLKEALDIRRQLAEASPEVNLPEVAMTLNNLGTVQHDMNQLEGAQQSYQEALGSHRQLADARPEVYLPYLANTLNNLGNLQNTLNQYEAAQQSLKVALDIGRQLADARPEVYLPYLANTLNSLGNLQGYVTQLEEAQQSYQEALEIRRQLAKARPEVYLPKVAMTLNSLGSLQRDVDQPEEALQNFKEALEISRQLAETSPEVYLPEVAMTLNNLGTAQSDMNQLEEAQQSFQEAVEIYSKGAHRQPSARVIERQRTWSNLGTLVSQENSGLGWPDHEEARRCFREARNCSEFFRNQFSNPDERKRVQHEAADIFDQLGESCLNIWKDYRHVEDLHEAVEVSEASRARHLSDLLADETIEPMRTPRGLVEKFRALHRNIRQLRSSLSANLEPSTVALASFLETRYTRLGPGAKRAPSTEEFSQKKWEAIRKGFNQIEIDYQRTLEEIQRRYDPEFDPNLPVPPLSFGDIADLIAGDTPTAAIQFQIASKNAFAVVITQSEVIPVDLPDFPGTKAWEFAEQWFRSYYDGRNTNSHECMATWEEQFPKQLEILFKMAVKPVVDAIAGRGIQRLVICPHRMLHLFPIHACKIDNETYIADRFEVCYSPSFAVLRRCASRVRPKPENMLLIRNPTADLDFSNVEGRAVIQRYSKVELLNESNAKKESILGGAQRSHVIHYTGHSVFNPDDPLDSGLVLGNKNQPRRWLSLRDVFTKGQFLECSLTILNGCETGFLLPDISDEYVNLSTGFLYAGSKCVISTLWPIYDLSCALLMNHFHRIWQRDDRIAEALREAQRWLREDIKSGTELINVFLPEFLEAIEDETLKSHCINRARAYANRFPDSPPFAHPVHWAGFIASGHAYPLTLER